MLQAPSLHGCLAAVSSPFPGRDIEQASEQEGKQEGGGGEEKRSIPNILLNFVCPSCIMHMHNFTSFCLRSIHMAESEEAYKFSVEEKLKDL